MALVLLVVVAVAAGLAAGVVVAGRAQARRQVDRDAHRRELAIEGLLGRVEQRLHDLELARQEAYVGLREQVGLLHQSQEMLRGHTASLVTALRAPATRGRWGELQLRRVVEMAGMVRHCDFTEQQASGASAAGDGRVRPDMVVTLPGGKRVVLDAKVPLQAYLSALEADDDRARRAGLGDHARQLRAHVDALAAKAYWQRFEPTPEFVVLFLPGDAILAAALEHDPSLLEYAADRHVLLATPVTLIALLRTIAYSWRQEALADSARAVCALGRELYERLGTLGAHVAGVGHSLDRAVESYNRAVGSLEGRVLVTARRFADLDVATGDLPAPDPVERACRRPQASELGALS